MNQKETNGRKAIIYFDIILFLFSVGAHIQRRHKLFIEKSYISERRVHCWNFCLLYLHGNVQYVTETNESNPQSIDKKYVFDLKWKLWCCNEPNFLVTNSYNVNKASIDIVKLHQNKNSQFHNNIA